MRNIHIITSKFIKKDRDQWFNKNKTQHSQKAPNKNEHK